MKSARIFLNVIGANAVILAFCVCERTYSVWWKAPFFMAMLLILGVGCFFVSSFLRKEKLTGFAKNVLRVLLAFHDAKDSYRASLSSTRGSARRTVRQ